MGTDPSPKLEKLYGMVAEGRDAATTTKRAKLLTATQSKYEVGMPSVPRNFVPKPTFFLSQIAGIEGVIFGNAD